MRIVTGWFSLAIVLLLAAGERAFPAKENLGQEKLVRFTGEVARDHEFRWPIGRGLVFALIPDVDKSGAQSGWTITIAPERPPGNSDCRDFAWVVMPPYRSYNHRYLNNTYGTTAKEAVEMSPRNFNFVLNCADYQVEAARVRKVLWRGNESDEEYNDTLAKLGSSPQGHGKLWIDKSKISPAVREIEGVNYGSIDWIQFHVEIRFP